MYETTTHLANPVLWGSGFTLAINIWSYSIAIITMIGVALVFEKAGEKWWKALIPFYDEWTETQIGRAPTSWFWTKMCATFVGVFVMSAGFMLLILGGVVDDGWSILVSGFFLVLAGFMLLILAVVFRGRILHRLALAFGKDIGFALGLLLLSPIFWLILAFDDSQYQPATASGEQTSGDSEQTQEESELYAAAPYAQQTATVPAADKSHSPAAAEEQKRPSRWTVVGFVLLILVPLFTVCTLAQLAMNLLNQSILTGAGPLF